MYRPVFVDTDKLDPGLRRGDEHEPEQVPRLASTYALVRYLERGFARVRARLQSETALFRAFRTLFSSFECPLLTRE